MHDQSGFCMGNVWMYRYMSNYPTHTLASGRIIYVVGTVLVGEVVIGTLEALS